LEKDLRIKITVDKNTGSLKVINSEFDDLDFKVNKTEKSFGTLKGSIAGLATAAVGIYAVEKALESVMKSGFSFNIELEEAKAGLISLSVAVQDKSIPVLERYNAANIEATSTLKELQRINAQTPHSLNETNKIYNAMYVSMKNAGASTSDMIELTRSISIASGAAGIEFNSLLAGVDGLATGTVLANSDLGRFLSSLGLTNEKLKESDDVVKLLINTLKDFKAADTMGIALSNLGNSWDVLTGKMTEDTFYGAKVGLNTLSDLLNKMSDEDITHAREMINGFSIGAINAVYGISVGVVELINAFDSLGARIAGIAFRVENGIFLSDEESKALERMYAQTHKNMKVREDFIEKLRLSKEAIETTISSNKSAIESQRKLNYEFANNKSKKQQKQKQQKQQTNTQDENEKLYREYINIVGTDYDKWVLNLSDTIERLSHNTQLSAEDFEKVYEALNKQNPLVIQANEEKKRQIDLEKEWQDVLDVNKTDILDAQIDLAQSALDWGNNLDGVAGKFESISKATNAYYVAELKAKKSKIDLDKKYEKQFTKFAGDELKTKQLLAMWESDRAKITEEKNNAELRAYSNLAGAIGNFYEEGSSAAKASQAVQATLGIVSGYGAITKAWASAPFPANLPAVAATTTAVLPLISQLSSLGGSGGGSSSQSISYAQQREDDYKQRADDYEESVKPITDRLDRQIEILDNIAGYDGNSLSLTLDKNIAELENTLSKNNIEAIGMLDVDDNGNGLANINFTNADKMQEIADIINSSYGEDIASVTQKYVNGIAFSNWGVSHFDYSKLEEDNYGVIKLIDGLLKNKSEIVSVYNSAYPNYFMSDNISDSDLLTLFGLDNSEYTKIIEDAKDASKEFVTQTLDGMNQLVDMSSSFKGYYDNITNTNFYKNDSLSKAYDDVYKLTNNTDISEYLKDQISSISLLESELTKENIELLQSQDSSDIIAQIELTKTLSEETKKALENGALEALNYKDSIALVSDAIASSANNIKTWEDSFKTETQLLEDMANNIDYQGNIATTNDELQNMFETLKDGVGGLTDAELEFLEANEKLIQKTQDIYEDVLGGWIDSLGGSLDTIQNTADSLRMLDNTTTLQDYYNSMSKTQELLQSGMYDEFNDELQKTISLTSALKDSSNFNSKEEMEFNQLVAASQFDQLGVNVNEELDVLKQIAQDTSESYKVQQDTLTIQLQQAEEIRKLRKELQDIRDEMAS